MPRKHDRNRMLAPLMRAALSAVALLTGCWCDTWAGDKCSHVYSLLGATQGDAPCVWLGSQTVGSCGSAHPEGVRLHQILVKGAVTEVFTTRLKDDYPDWMHLESWLAKSGTVPARRFVFRDDDWRLDLGEEVLVLVPPRGETAPGLVNRRTRTLRRVKAGPGGEIIRMAWYFPALRLVLVVTRAAGPENSVLEGYALLRIQDSRR